MLQRKTTLLLILGTVLLMFLIRIPEARATTLGEATILVETLNVRSGPGLDYERIGHIKEGETYPVLKEQERWYKLRLAEDLEGWVASWFVQLNTNKENPQVINAKVDHLNIRSGPDVSYQVIGQINPEETYALLKTEGDWSLIQLADGETGWVANWLVEIREGEPSEWNQISIDAPKRHIDGSVAQVPEQNPASSTKEVIISVLYDGTNIRKGPGTQYAVIQQANQGERYQVLDREGDWYQIALVDGQTAYIASWIVAIEGLALEFNEEMLHHLMGKKIVIDPGHGGKDNGATGTHFKTLEKEINLQNALLLKSKLEAAGAQVMLTRSTDEYISLEERVQLSISEQADAFLSIHHNTAPNQQINGTISFYYTEEDQKLAHYIQAQLVKHGGLRNLNARYGNYYVLRENPRPSVLLELGFLSHYQDEWTVRTMEFQDKVTTAMLYGLAQYFHLKETDAR